MHVKAPMFKALPSTFRLDSSLALVAAYSTSSVSQTQHMQTEHILSYLKPAPEPYELFK